MQLEPGGNPNRNSTQTVTQAQDQTEGLWSGNMSPPGCPCYIRLWQFLSSHSINSMRSRPVSIPGSVIALLPDCVCLFCVTPWALSLKPNQACFLFSKPYFSVLPGYIRNNFLFTFISGNVNNRSLTSFCFEVKNTIKHAERFHPEKFVVAGLSQTVI